MGSIKQQMGGREWAMLLALALLWGGSFFFVEIAIGSVSPLAIVFLRVVLAAIALWCFSACAGVSIPRERPIWSAFAVMAVLNNVIPFSLIVWGQRDVGAALASILNATTPFLTVLVAGVCLPDERMAPNKVIGVMVGFFGVALVVGGNRVIDLGQDLMAQLAIIGAALSYACAGVYGRRFKQMRINPIAVATGQVTMSSLVLALLVLVFGVALPSPNIGWTVWLALLGLGLFSTAVAYILYFRLLESAGATNLLLVTLLIPVVATGLGVAVLGEALGAADYAGMALIGVGLLTIDGRFLIAALPRL
ncbi:DMT family transporter [Salinisphaera sp. LB1]|uniref:DMT family transporter n=1 Tax=Salinisphaera sp. LB1 TaxID=2183911 RepID=UPI000D707D51|nr:DMT family transporter [Salinisphaera sp. LB1]AWN15711.1 Permease of the drug/metabolite transporter (DMT) superfamily [Salinisphaera sp. LB1]